MLEALEEPIRRLLKVPPQPDPPRGDPGSVRVFRAAPGFFSYRLVLWGSKQLATLVGLVWALLLFGGLSYGLDLSAMLGELGDRPVAGLLPALLGTVEALAIAAFLVQLPLSFLLVALDYRYRWYVVTDRSLRIREGLWKVRERTMTFSNLQNVTVRQGPVQRLFGIADLEVRTAGGGGGQGEGKEPGSSERLHVGYFRGIANAAEIRDLVLARLRRLRASGLGDPDEPAAVATAGAGGATAAAAELLRETRALAALLRGAPGG